MGKMLVLTFEDSEEELLEKIVSTLADEANFEVVQPVSSPVLSFPGLEIRLHQRRVLRDGVDVSLTRLEYRLLTYLASYPGIVFTKEQIFEKVWYMESESCFHVVAGLISRLREKIEPDRQHPTYIHTVLDGYKFEPKKTEK